MILFSIFIWLMLVHVYIHKVHVHLLAFSCLSIFIIHVQCIFVWFWIFEHKVSLLQVQDIECKIMGMNKSKIGSVNVLHPIFALINHQFVAFQIKPTNPHHIYNISNISYAPNLTLSLNYNTYATPMQFEYDYLKPLWTLEL